MGQVIYSHEMKATPDKIWAIISDVTRLPDWAYTEGRFPYPTKGEYGGEQHAGVGTLWVGTSADGQKATQKITVWEVNKLLAYELQAAENAPLAMTQSNSFTLEPTAQGTKITWQVDWALTGGWSLNSIMMRFTANGSFEEIMEGSLAKLKHVAES